MKRLLSNIWNGRSSGARHAVKRSLRPWHAGLVAIPAILALTGGCLAAATTTLPATLASSTTSASAHNDGRSSWGQSNKHKHKHARGHHHPAPKSSRDASSTTPAPKQPIPSPSTPAPVKPVIPVPVAPAPVTSPLTKPAPITPPVTAPAPIPTPTSAPPSGSFPTAATTGVPAGVTLTSMAGLTITTPGTVIDSKNVNGNITVAANNVTIKNSKINGRVIARGISGLLLQRVEIAGPSSTTEKLPGVGYSGFTCDGCNVHGWGDGFMMDNDVTIKNSWVHDLKAFGDPANGGSHNQAILSLGGNNFTITNNRLDAGSQGNFSASLSLFNQWGAITNTLVQGNLFNGGGYCVYAGYDVAGKNYPSNVRYINNTFGSTVSPKCGFYGAAVDYYPGNGDAWSGNVTDKGVAVPAPIART